MSEEKPKTHQNPNLQLQSREVNLSEPALSLASETIVVSNLSIVAASGKELVSDLSFSVGQRECIAIIGAEGSGKSSVIEYLAGMKREGFTYSGQVSTLGASGYLPQELHASWDSLPIIEFLFKQTADESFDLDKFSCRTASPNSPLVFI